MPKGTGGFGVAHKGWRADLQMNCDSAAEANVARWIHWLMIQRKVICFQRERIKISFGDKGTANDATQPDFWLVLPFEPQGIAPWFDVVWEMNRTHCFGSAFILPVEVKQRLEIGGALADVTEEQLKLLQSKHKDPASAIKLRRAKKLYDRDPYVVIGDQEYADIRRTFSAICPSWEGVRAKVRSSSAGISGKSRRSTKARPGDAV